MERLYKDCCLNCVVHLSEKRYNFYENFSDQEEKMRFINPKTDYAFKIIFGSDQSKEILISFLNAILYQEKDVIQDL